MTKTYIQKLREAEYKSPKTINILKEILGYKQKKKRRKK